MISITQRRIAIKFSKTIYVIENSVGFTVIFFPKEKLFQKLLRFFQRPYLLAAYGTTSSVCGFDVGTVCDDYVRCCSKQSLTTVARHKVSPLLKSPMQRWSFMNKYCIFLTTINIINFAFGH